MATPGAVKAGSAYIEYFADDRKAMNSAKNLSKNIQSISGQMRGAFAAVGIGLGVSEIMNFGKAVLKAGDDIDKGSKRLSISAEQYQRLGLMAGFSGAEASNVEMAFKTVADVISEAGMDSQEYVEKLGLIGLRYNDLKNLSPYESFEKVAKSIAAIQNPTERLSAATAMFGKSGKQLMPLIMDFEAVNKQVDDTATLMSGDAVDAAAKFNDKIEAISTSFKAALANNKAFQESLNKTIDTMMAADALQSKRSEKKGITSKYNTSSLPGIWDNLMLAMGIGEGERVRADLTDADKAALEAFKKEKESAGGATKKEIESDKQAKQAAVIEETRNKKLLDEQEKKRKKLAEFLQDQIQGLQDEAAEHAFINQKLERQWYIYKEIAKAQREAEKAGAELTEEQRNQIAESAAKAYDIGKKKDISDTERKLYQSDGTFDANAASAFKAIQTTQTKDAEIAQNTKKSVETLSEIKRDSAEVARYIKLYGTGITIK